MLTDILLRNDYFLKLVFISLYQNNTKTLKKY